MYSNPQAPEKRVPDTVHTLDVHSIFPTIQGEGIYVGEPAVFIRLAGCNLQCPLCDTDYTNGRQSLTLEQIWNVVDHLVKKNPGICLVVITGGEPFRQDFSRLAAGLIARGLLVQVETNGTLPPHPNFFNLNILIEYDRTQFSVVCSPKTGKVHSRILEIMAWPSGAAFKYVLDANSIGKDGLPVQALGHPVASRVYRADKRVFTVFIQPADMRDALGHSDEEANKRNLQACIQSSMQHGYTLGIQLHKIIGVE